MRCPKAKKLISAYIDNELNSRDHSALEQHLSTCRECGLALAEARTIHSFFSQAITFEAPPGLLSRVRANIREHQTVGSSAMPFAFLPRMAAVFFVTVILITGVISGNILMRGVMPRPAEKPDLVLALDMFDPAPPGTIGGAYLALTENSHEK